MPVRSEERRVEELLDALRYIVTDASVALRCLVYMAEPDVALELEAIRFVERLLSSAVDRLLGGAGISASYAVERGGNYEFSLHVVIDGVRYRVDGGDAGHWSWGSWSIED